MMWGERFGENDQKGVHRYRFYFFVANSSKVSKTYQYQLQLTHIINFMKFMACG